MISDTEEFVHDIIKLLANFPYGQVCKHFVMASLLDQLERKEFTINPELAKAIMDCEDEKILCLLNNNA